MLYSICFMPMSTNSSQLSAESFGSLFQQLIRPGTLNTLGRRHRTSAAGAPAKLSLFWLVTGLIYHVLQTSGLLSTHIRQVAGRKASDSALSERRQGIGLPFFQALLDLVLQGIARIDLHPQAFYKGLLLTGIDGSQWSVSNTPPIKKRIKKTRTRRRSAAFFKLSMAAIYELGTHNPMAARIGINGESEMALALPLLSSLREDWLLIADRYYGLARFVFHLMALPIQTHFLLRVRSNLKSKLIYRLADGSCLVQIRDNTSGKHIQLREIHASVCRRSGRWISIRLWTNLLDHTRYPAKELVALYGLRWEHEIAYKELKVHLRRSPLLLSHTLGTAGQEVACLVLAQAIVARLRLAAASDHTPLLQISFIRTLDAFRSLWTTMPLLHDLLPADAIPKLLRRLMQQLAQQAAPPRRKRSCPRALRQPVSKWPRLLVNSSTNGPFQFKIRRNRS
jgi:hypothetical protein